MSSIQNKEELDYLVKKVVNFCIEIKSIGQVLDKGESYASISPNYETIKFINEGVFLNYFKKEKKEYRYTRFDKLLERIDKISSILAFLLGLSISSLLKYIQTFF